MKIGWDSDTEHGEFWKPCPSGEAAVLFPPTYLHITTKAGLGRTLLRAHQPNTDVFQSEETVKVFPESRVHT